MKLSSRLLLDLIRGFPDKSDFKTHAAPPFGRDGNWPVSMQMLKHLTNETARNRASKYAGGDHEYMPTIYFDPVEALELHEEARAEEDDIGYALDACDE
ncbi:hypothetical protein M2272_005850 [Mycobacterium frederiksbergense]|uniref:Uncharacterized protein n=1 Tax=Mycolicibacterium frederiksbergense TaxID=117567 RepID=A0ABT6L8A3_9MYCO|nr:hypothetical protein [Mycolicibacterium frederiksbergense]MDH6199182.1 hypothetical protein [Mycolicibacterium frederiksbergense]